jgi:hypothetical protein
VRRSGLPPPSPTVAEAMERDVDLSALPYWQVNVPIQERTAECPEFLASVSAKDRGILSTPDSEYRADTWDEVCEKIRCNRIDLFRRKPSDLRRYLAYSWQLKRDYGSVMNFMISERLGWAQPISARSRPFQFADDLRILRNDWPCTSASFFFGTTSVADPTEPRWN